MGYQSIYNRLRGYGLTEAGALALLGNWECESNCEPGRKQGDFDPYRRASRENVVAIENGSKSRETFKQDAVGFGLAQWTYFTRKAALYDYWKAKGGSIADEALQVDFAMLELKSDFPGLLNELKTSNDLEQCVTDVCYKFENPAVKNTEARYEAAKNIRAQIDLNGSEIPNSSDDLESVAEPDEHKLVLRTIDKNCLDWPETVLLGSLLYCRNYMNYAPGYWDDEMTEAVKAFQKDAFPGNPSDWDGIVGPKTWNKLIERG